MAIKIQKIKIAEFSSAIFTLYKIFWGKIYYTLIVTYNYDKFVTD